MSTIKRIFVDIPQEHPLAAVRRHFAVYTQSGGHLTGSSGLGAAWDAVNPMLLTASSRAQSILDDMTGGKTVAVCIAWSFSTSPDRGTATLTWANDRRVLRFRFLHNKAQMQVNVPNADIAGSFKPTGMCMYLPTHNEDGVLGIQLESPYIYMWDDARPFQRIEVLHERFISDRMEDLQETMPLEAAQVALGLTGGGSVLDGMGNEEPFMSRREAAQKIADDMASQMAAVWDSIIPAAQMTRNPAVVMLAEMARRLAFADIPDADVPPVDPLRRAYNAASPPVQAAVNALLGYTPQ